MLRFGKISILILGLCLFVSCLSLKELVPNPTPPAVWPGTIKPLPTPDPTPADDFPENYPVSQGFPWYVVMNASAQTGPVGISGMVEIKYNGSGGSDDHTKFIIYLYQWGTILENSPYRFTFTKSQMVFTNTNGDSITYSGEAEDYFKHNFNNAFNPSRNDFGSYETSFCMTLRHITDSTHYEEGVYDYDRTPW